MNKKRYETFSPDAKRKEELQNLSFVLTTESHIEGVFKLMSDFNRDLERDVLREKVHREITQYVDGVRYGLYVALYKNEVVGLCRFFYSQDVPKEKIKFPDYPEGCYCMGITVSSEFRRRGIASFLTQKRFERFKELGLKEVYSTVASDNPTSIRMHEKFGFKEIERGPGYLTVGFDSGEGILFKKNLKEE